MFYCCTLNKKFKKKITNISLIFIFVLKLYTVNIRCFDARIYSFLFLCLIQILAQTINSRTHEPREYRGNMMRADISTLTVQAAVSQVNFTIVELLEEKTRQAAVSQVNVTIVDLLEEKTRLLYEGIAKCSWTKALIFLFVHTVA